MASLANMRFWHITVMDGYKTIFTQKCLSVGDANKLYKEKKEEYAGKGFSILKENY